MKNNNILYRKASLLFVPFLLALLIGFSACSDSDDKGDEHFEIGFAQLKAGEVPIYTPLVDGYRMEVTGGQSAKYDFYVYSNIGRWVLETEKKEDTKWIDIWPGEGDDDGLFALQVAKNESFTPRSSALKLVANGKVYVTIPIEQAAGDASLTISPKTKKVPVEGSGGPYEVVVTTNVGWKAELENAENTPWVKIVETTANSVRYIVYENTANASGAAPVQRVAKINFVGVDNDTKKETLTITQDGAAV